MFDAYQTNQYDGNKKYIFELQDATVEAEPVSAPKNTRKRKTTHNDPSYGSFFLRVGAIGMNEI